MRFRAKYISTKSAAIYWRTIDADNVNEAMKLAARYARKGYTLAGVMQSIGLKALRLKLGLTQPQLAERLFITRDAVAKLESGRNSMSKPVKELARQLAATPPN